MTAVSPPRQLLDSGPTYEDIQGQATTTLQQDESWRVAATLSLLPPSPVLTLQQRQRPVQRPRAPSKLSLSLLQSIAGLEDSFLKSLSKADAADILGFVDKMLDCEDVHLDRRQQRRLHRVIRKLIVYHEIAPTSFFISDVSRDGEHPIAGGGFADVYQGKLRGKPMCLKVLRMYLDSADTHDQTAMRSFFKEALVWKQLDHENIMPFLGIDNTCFPGRPCFVSPFMRHQDLMSFLQKNPQYDRISGLAGVAAGLRYLHDLKISHGDIKGANILVDDDFCCRLADFGISSIVASSASMSTSSNHLKGSLRWMPPETLFPETVESYENLPLSRDIYAFACTVVEVCTGEPPFGAKMTDYQVILSMTSGQRPSRPQVHYFSDGLWDLIQWCWHQDPVSRPTAEEVADAMLHYRTYRPVNRDMYVASVAL